MESPATIIALYIIVATIIASDNPKTGDLKMWIKFRDSSIYKTIDYASAKKYIGKHDGESYALAQFKFPKATRNLLVDLYTACVQTVSTGEQRCAIYPWTSSKGVYGSISWDW